MEAANDSSKQARRNLRDSEDGAIVVLGVFFAVFILGMIYYMVGLGDVIQYHERMQDAADASAFGSAVVHARGMNIIALINIIMAAVLAVLVVLKLVEMLITVAIGLLLIASIFGGGAASAIPPLETQRRNVRQMAETVEPIIDNILVVLHQLGEVVKMVTPIGSNLSVIGRVASQYEVATVAFAIPSRLQLPVEDDEYSYLCRKAGEMAGDLAMLPLEPFLPGFITDGVSSALGSLTGSLDEWFCGGGGSPPRIEIPDQRQNSPRSEASLDCARAAENNEPDFEETCRNAEERDMRSQPDPVTGECRVGQPVCVDLPDDPDAGTVWDPPEDSYCANEGRTDTVLQSDCEPGGAYYERLQLTRQQCAPNGISGGNGQQSGYWYRRQQVEVTWEWREDRWVETDRTVTEDEVERHDEDDDTQPPCGDVPWNTDVDEVVCENIPLPGNPPVNPRTGSSSGAGGSPITRRTQGPVVVQAFGCRSLVEGQTVQAGDLDLSESSGGDTDDWDQSSAGGSFQDMAGVDQGGANNNQGNTGRNKNPFRFLGPYEDKAAHMLGTSDLQVRSVVIGRNLSEYLPSMAQSDATVRMTRWQTVNDGRPGERRRMVSGAEGPFLQAAQRLGQVAVAQAEYYFDWEQLGGDLSDELSDREYPGSQRDWMWYMGWTARIRRFRMSWENSDGDNANADSRTTEGDSNSGAAGGGQTLEQVAPAPGSNGSVSADNMACDADPDQCNAGSDFLTRFGELIIH